MFIDELLEANAEWAQKRNEADPGFFPRLKAEAQSPKALWIGCADSRVSPEQITLAEPGTLFVHRNIANVVHAGDLNLMSVMHYALHALKVEHIVVCGHEVCGGVQAALKGLRGDLLDQWLAPVAEVARDKMEELENLEDDAARIAHLVELNVLAQVNHLANSPAVRLAWANAQPLKIHGMVYKLSTGRLERLASLVQGLKS